MSKPDPLESAAKEVRDTFAFVGAFIRGPVREIRKGLGELKEIMTGDEPTRAGSTSAPSDARVVCATCGNRRKLGNPGHEIDCPNCVR